MNHDPARDLPVFSPRLDELMAAMLKGDAPNAGRFCGYCYTPLRKRAEECEHCRRSLSEWEPVSKLPADFGALYKRMRRRESLIVNAFAFAGLALGVLLFGIVVAIAVYPLDGSIPMLIFSLVVLLVGGRVFAGLLGGWIGDDIGYNYARRKLAEEWRAYEAEREHRRASGVSHAPGRAGVAPTSR
jgi:hypothetical protein